MEGEIMFRSGVIFFVVLLQFFVIPPAIEAQNNSHPHLYFDSDGMDALRDRALNDPRLNLMWREFKRENVDRAMKVVVPDGPFTGVGDRDYGDALNDLAMGWIVLRDRRYVDKAKEIIFDIIAKPSWGEQLVVAHISIGLAFCWDVMYSEFSAGERNAIRDNARARAGNHANPNPLSNHNWTPSAGEGLIGLAFGFNDLLQEAKNNFKESPTSVLWAHGNDGFSPQGPGYWRKYNHVALFFHALRFNEPANDWFHLGKEYPGSEFLGKSSYPRIYGDIQHQDFSCITWCDSKQIGTEPAGPFGSIGMLMLAASEYRDGYVMDFIDQSLARNPFRFDPEDFGAFIFYNDDNTPSRSYTDLPLGGYWPNMEGAVFRSGWTKNDIIFFMRSGSPGGHTRPIKGLPPDQHSHPDANGFVLFYNNDYLAAEDGAAPQYGPDFDRVITYGHNTVLVDGAGQKGDKSERLGASDANMDFLDANHVGYLLGDATDSYPSLNRFYRYVIYKKHKYFIVVDELKDDVNHKYEFLLGTDHRHTISSSGADKFVVRPTTGNAKLPVVFVEPRSLNSSIDDERPYIFSDTPVDMLRVWPDENARDAQFFALLYPRKNNEPDPGYTKIYDGGRSGIQVDGDEIFLYNDSSESYTHGDVATDAKLCYFKNNRNAFEYLAAGSREFLYQGERGISSDRPLVAAFEGATGKIRLGKNLGVSGEALITLFHPGITGVRVDGNSQPIVSSASGRVSFRLSPKQYKIGPNGYEQTVTDNYDVEILTGGTPPPPSFVQIISPNGGENWAVGSSQSIQWNSDGGFPNVKIEYSTNSSGSWQSVANSTANDGQFTWVVPNAVSDNALVRISDLTDGVPSDVSNDVFAIVGDGPGPAPIITSFTPASGSTGTVVTISGSNLGGSTEVKFNGVAGSFSIISASEIVATVPAGASTGRITVASAAGAATSSADFVIIDGGGSEIALLPTDDTYIRSSKPGEKNGSVKSLRVWKTSSAEYFAYFKFAVSGAGTVSRARLRLHVLDASPDGGSIHLVSNNYDGSSTSWKEADMNWNNAPKISGPAIATAGAATLNSPVEFDVSTVITGDGEYSFAIRNNSADVLKYASKEDSHPPLLIITGGAPSNAPVITSFSPTSGPVGTTVTIAGNRFNGTTEVTFNGVSAASVGVVSNTQIFAEVPPSATSGPIRVTTGSGAALSSSEFSVTTSPTPIPIISGFTPTSGPVGTVVTIGGENFTGATSVKFNGTEAGFLTSNNSQILATAPPGATTGKISATTGAGTGVSLQDFVVTSDSGPQTLSFIPTDDGFVWSNNPANNYGTSSDLRVRKTGEWQIAYFKFNVTRVSGSVTAARLRLSCTDGSNDGGSAYLVSNEVANGVAWTESGLTWLNAPAVGGLALSSAGVVSSGQIVEFDVTSAINGDGIFSFAIRNASTNVANYSSKEGGVVPELVVATEQTVTSLKELESNVDGRDLLPERIALLPNYPNPFNAETTIGFGLHEAANIQLAIFNIRGQRVRELMNGFRPSGFTYVQWDGRDDYGASAGSGVYFILLRAGDQQVIREITLQK
jgi:hypothetical protein